MQNNQRSYSFLFYLIWKTTPNWIVSIKTERHHKNVLFNIFQLKKASKLPFLDQNEKHPRNVFVSILSNLKNNSKCSFDFFEIKKQPKEIFRIFFGIEKQIKTMIFSENSIFLQTGLFQRWPINVFWKHHLFVFFLVLPQNS